MNNYKSVRLILSIVAAALGGGFCHSHATPLGTAFTYQGRLTTASGPANGTYELWFGLYDVPTGGSGLWNGPSFVAVTGGVFSVTLDFGAVFQGALRYLEILARTNEPSASYAVLPRQPLTPAPNALWATRAASADLAAWAGSAGSMPGLTVTPQGTEVNQERTDQLNYVYEPLYLGEGQTVWQSFTPALSGWLYYIYLLGEGRVTLKLYHGEGTNGTLLCTAADQPTGRIYTALAAPIIAGSQYTFEVSLADCFDCYLNASTEDTYAGGRCSRGGDLMFATVFSSYWVTNYQTALFGQQPHSGALSINGSVTAAAFTGNGAGLTNLNAASLTGSVPAGALTSVPAANLTGTVVDARLSTNVALLNVGQTFTAAPMFAAGLTFSNSIHSSGGNPRGLHAIDLQITRANDTEVAGGVDATLGGGFNNTSSGNGSTVAGGGFNIASGYTATVSGGDQNSATGDRSVIPGGAANEASAWWSFAAGRAAKSRHDLSFVWNGDWANDFASTAPQQFLIGAPNGVGINKNNPGSALDVNGTVTAVNFTGNGAGLTNLTPADGSVSAVKLASDGASLSKVSGGLLSSDLGFLVASHPSWSSKVMMLTSSNELGASFGLTSAYPGGSDWTIMSTANGANDLYDTAPGSLLLSSHDTNGIRSQPMVLTRAGNVGIGEGHPQYKLDVAGEAAVNVLTIRGGSDLAEPFNIASAGDLIPGMVVSIDPEKPGDLRVSTQAYDHRVAGIISGAGNVKPGLMLKQEDSIASGKHPVALSGRVYCYADADAGGPIRPGDLLTTSGTPGHAMKATDVERRSGAIIGKAMTPLDQGKGLVLVLVNLQ